MARGKALPDNWLKESIVDEIILKAYADCIVASLIERNGGHTTAAVALGETNYDSDETGPILQQAVKFWWEADSRVLGIVDRSMHAVLQYRVETGQVNVSYSPDWDIFSPQTVQSAADWIVMQEDQG